MYLPDGPARPERAELDAFWAGALRARPELRAGSGPTPEPRFDGRPYQVRWIGLDHDSTEQILELIRSGDKTGTFTLPWILARTGEPEPRAGDPIVLIDYQGRPRLLVRLTKVHGVAFGDITEADIAVDGTPVRTLAVWKPLHTRYWNTLLAPFGLVVSDAMPVLVEAFELLAEPGPLSG